MKIFRKIIPYLPPVIWMGLIFFASSRQAIGVSGIFYINFIIFKTLHIIIYGLLFLFWRLALHRISYSNYYSILISFTYGIIDEIHQSFVPTREGTVRDVFINLIGILLFSLLFPKFILPRLKKIDFVNRVYKLS